LPNTLPDLPTHFAFIEAECLAAKAAPLSTRKAMLAAMLIDAFPDRAFATRAGVGDILAFRADLAAASPALALIFALCSQRADSPRLALQSIQIPVPDYAGLPVEDFMVSLYNDHTVQRLLLVEPGGQRSDIHDLLAQGLAALRPLVA